MADTKYLINVDFPEVSRVHLNPDKYDIDSRCRTRPKNPDVGGSLLVTEEEASRYLRHESMLTFHNKPVKNLQKCKLCSIKSEYHLP